MGPRLIQNIPKRIDNKELPHTKQMNRVQNIQIKASKYKAVEFLKIYIGKVSACGFCFS